MNFANKLSAEGSTPFQVFAPAFWVPVTTAGYTLKYSGDGTNWVSYADATTAGDTLLVKNVPAGLWFKLDGLSETVVITY